MLVTNQSENIGEDMAPKFTLDEQVLGTVIANKRKGNFGMYFFLINNLIKHADAKAYNRHVTTGAMKPGELISVGQEALGLLLLENYRATWEQHVNALKSGTTVPSNDVLRTKYTNPGNKRSPWSKEGLQRYNVLHAEVNADRESEEGKKFEVEFQKKMQVEAGKASSRKRKAIPEVEVAAAHELDSDDDDDSGSAGRRQGLGTASAVSELSESQATGSTPV